MDAENNVFIIDKGGAQLVLQPKEAGIPRTKGDSKQRALVVKRTEGIR